jgi:hypothetical protein
MKTKTFTLIMALISASAHSADQETTPVATALEGSVTILYCDSIEWDGDRPIPYYSSRHIKPWTLELKDLDAQKEIVITQNTDYDILDSSNNVKGKAKANVSITLKREFNKKITAKVKYSSVNLADLSDTGEYSTNEATFDANTGLIAEFNPCDDKRNIGKITTKFMALKKRD